MQLTPHDNLSGFPKYLILARRFEKQMRDGVLRVGDRLPSVRQLQANHRVSAATAIGCYAWLESQGYIRSRPKSGFYVRDAPGSNGPAPIAMLRSRGPVGIRTADHAPV